MAYAEQLKSGRFSAVVENVETGRRYRIKDDHGRTFPDRESAERAARAEQQRIENRIYGGPWTSSTNAPRLADYATVAISRLSGIERSTRSKYCGVANQLIEHFGDAITVGEITRPMVRDMLATADRKGIGASQRGLYVHVLRHIMNAAIDDEYRGDDPTRGVRVPAPTRRYATLVSDDELHMIGCALPYYLWPAVLLSHDAGLRISEVVGLRREHVNVLHKRLHVSTVRDFDNAERAYPKGKQAHTIPMSERLTTALDRHMREHGDFGTGFVFVNQETGEPVTAQQLRRAWNRARKLVGIESAHWHDLRHGCAQILVDAGYPLWAVQAILRHKTPATTMRYVDRIPLDRLAQYVSAFDLTNMSDAAAAPVAESPRAQVAVMR